MEDVFRGKPPLWEFENISIESSHIASTVHLLHR
jgi:hypothetical protein